MGAVIPDEDYVGLIVQYVCQNKTKSKYVSAYDEHVYDAIDGWDHATRHMVETRAMAELTHLQKKVMLGSNDDYAVVSRIGKKLVGKLPDSAMRAIIGTGCPVGHQGPLAYDELWTFDKLKCQDLLKDCYNFFQLAERVR